MFTTGPQPGSAQSASGLRDRLEVVRLGVLPDVELGHYDENLVIRELDRDAASINLPWFVTS